MIGQKRDLQSYKCDYCEQFMMNLNKILSTCSLLQNSPFRNSNYNQTTTKSIGCQSISKDPDANNDCTMTTDLDCHELNKILCEQLQSTCNVLNEVSEELNRLRNENLLLKRQNSVIKEIVEGELQNHCVLDDRHLSYACVSNFDQRSKSNISYACKNKKIIVYADSHGRNLSNILSNMQEEYSISGNIYPNASLAAILKSLRADHEVKALTKADYVVLLGGTNDVQNTEKIFCVESLIGHLEQCIELTAHTNLVLFTLPYQYDKHEFGFENKLVKSINTRIRELASAFNIQCVDVYTTPRRYQTNHGLHFNRTGKKYVCQKIIEIVSQGEKVSDLSFKRNTYKFASCNGNLDESSLDIVECGSFYTLDETFETDVSIVDLPDYGSFYTVDETFGTVTSFLDLPDRGSLHVGDRTFETETSLMAYTPNNTCDKEKSNKSVLYSGSNVNHQGMSVACDSGSESSSPVSCDDLKLSLGPSNYARSELDIFHNSSSEENLFMGFSSPDGHDVVSKRAFLDKVVLPQSWH